MAGSTLLAASIGQTCSKSTVNSLFGLLLLFVRVVHCVLGARAPTLICGILLLVLFELLQSAKGHTIIRRNSVAGFTVAVSSNPNVAYVCGTPSTEGWVN
eukprot:1488574-Pyramimonas_sp.AAC.2